MSAFYNAAMRLKLSLALVLCVAANAAGDVVPTFEQSLGMKSVGGAQVSPDGRYVAYTVTQANWDENDFVTQIWVANPATGERYSALPAGEKSAYGAAVAGLSPSRLHKRSRWQTPDLPDLTHGR